MAFNTHLADRITEELNAKNVQFEELKMFGGLCYMVDEKMCVGIIGDDLMARVDPDKMDELLHETGADHMMFTGRRMKSFLTISAEAIQSEEGLHFWIQECLEYNPKAKKSKKRKKK